nr:hypothetical protein [Lachnospiraceae bacterium]
MRKRNFLKAVVMTMIMALLVSGTAFAATPGQALDGKEVKYGTVSSADASVLRTMFDAEYYAKEHEDVAKIVGKNANALFNHFLRYGIFEGRAASKDFNVSAYKSSYGDLQKAFKDDIISYYLHYAKFGKAEKRELVTVEKAEAAGVTIQSVVPGATKTVLTPKQEEAKKPASGSSASSSSGSSSPTTPVTTNTVTITANGDTSLNENDTTTELTFTATWTDDISGNVIAWTQSGSYLTLDDDDTATVTVKLATDLSSILTANETVTLTVDVDGVQATQAITIVHAGETDSTAPTLSAGSVNRTSDTAATISFTSDEAGVYYYAVVDDGEQAPNIDTDGAGTAMVAGSNADIAVTLTA